MVVRLVRAGVGALLLLIAVPLGLAGCGLSVAMEHRAADDTFTARLERLRSGGRAVVVPDIDALLRADAPFARGGQTTLNLSAVGSSGPLFIGLAPDTAVQQYLDGLVQARVSRVRLALGPLPVELTEIETRAAAASGGAASGQRTGGPAVAGPGTGPGSNSGNADPNTTTGDPNAGADPNTTGDPSANPADQNATGQNPADQNAAGPNAADPNAADPNAADPNAAGQNAADQNTAGPNAADPNAAGNPSAGNPGSVDPGAGGPAVTGAGGVAVPLGVPAEQEFWLAKSIMVDGVAQLAWSPSALRGRHLALVVMNADGTAGINATVTARLAPAWIGPTAGGLLMLGTALFLLALLILAWPQRRAEERLVLPTLPSQPAKGRGRASLRRNLSTLSDPIAALLNPVVPKSRDTAPAGTIAVTSQTDVEADLQTTVIGAVTTQERTGEAPAAAEATQVVAEAGGDGPAVQVEGAGVPATQQQTGRTVVDDESPAEAADEATPEAAEEAAEEGLAQSELDRPAPVGGIDDDGPGPVVLPPLPKLPAIELQFTWAPVAVDEQEEVSTSS